MKAIKKFVQFLKKNYIILLILIVICLALYFSYTSRGIIYSIINSDRDAVIDFVNSFGKFSYFIFIFLVILEVILAPIPPFILYVAGGVLFGTLWGGLLTLTGNIIGSFIDFEIARKYGRNFVEKKVDRSIRKKFDNFSEKYGAFSLFLLRVNPFTTSDLFSYLSGLTKMKLRSFILGTTLGLIPMIFIQTYFGEAFIRTHYTLYKVLIGISIAYLLVFVYLIWRIFTKKQEVLHEVSKEENLILPKEI